MNADELKRIRFALGLTQAQLADLLGVRRVTVARWETGIRGISEPVARLVEHIRAGELGVSLGITGLRA
ncbi:MAG: helix-turn-helix domain-containing protein [Candidatus Rokubacteria bacterium]|nr:helix-turn-helix domain-containing protein [Candidatus Rokubacteria bacterium]